MPDHIAKRFILQIQDKCKEILGLYSDKEEEKKAETEVLAGQRHVSWRTEGTVNLYVTVD